MTGPRRVLVTGAAGGIGHETVRDLVAHGSAVTALDIAGTLPPEADRHVHGDAGDPTVVGAALADVDAVVHLAAIPHPSLGTPEHVYRTNVTATFTVLATAGEAGVRRAVIASSINASGIPFNPHDIAPAYYPIDEDLPVDIADAYSLSKNADERTAAMAHRTWGIDVVALRFPLTKDEPTLREVAAVTARDPAHTVREGWSYLDVRDAARAIRLALVVELAGAHVVGLGAEDTLLDADTEVLLGRWAPGVPHRRPMPGRTAAVDVTRARELLGFTPRWSIHRDGPADGPADAADADAAGRTRSAAQA
jgi:nucleoside-diphosphate-sugar epimerase